MNPSHFACQKALFSLLLLSALMATEWFRPCVSSLCQQSATLARKSLPAVPSDKKAARQRTLNRDLLSAVEKGDKKQVIALLRQGADPNTRNDAGVCVLFIAMKCPG